MQPEIGKTYEIVRVTNDSFHIKVIKIESEWITGEITKIITRHHRTRNYQIGDIRSTHADYWKSIKEVKP